MMEGVNSSETVNFTRLHGTTSQKTVIFKLLGSSKCVRFQRVSRSLEAEEGWREKHTEFKINAKTVTGNNNNNNSNNCCNI
jgi:hypothetical protein